MKVIPRELLAAASGLLLLCVFPQAAGGAGLPAPADSTITFFYYEDLSEVAPFYGEVMGLEQTLEMEWVKIFEITPTSSVGLTQEDKGYHDSTEDKPVMLSIVTKDVNAWYERLTGAGAKVVKELPSEDDMPAAHEAPIRGFIVEDPGGYTVEIFAWRKAENGAEGNGVE